MSAGVGADVLERTADGAAQSGSDGGRSPADDPQWPVIFDVRQSWRRLAPFLAFDFRLQHLRQSISGPLEVRFDACQPRRNGLAVDFVVVDAGERNFIGD